MNSCQVQISLGSLALTFQREAINGQKALNDKHIDAFYEKATTFFSGILPLINNSRKIPRLSQTHFALMLDDARF